MCSDAIAAWMTYGAAAAQRQRAVERLAPAGDLRGVPARAVLVGEQHELAVVEPGVPARIVEQHQRPQAVHLGLVRHQLGERRAEPQRLRGEVDAAAVALVEDQVDDRQHRRQPLGQQMVGRNPERDARILILRFARDRRRFIVSSETRNARAISSVRSPPSARKRQRDLRLERRARDGST